MTLSEILHSAGRFIGLYSDTEPGQANPAYDEHGRPERDYEPAQDDGGFQSSYGTGGSYVRAGARPTKQSSTPRRSVEEPEPSRGLFGGKASSQARTAPPYTPDNVIRMPGREEHDAPDFKGQQAQSSSTIIFCVRRKDDSSQIINYLLQGVNVILNFEEVDDVQCQRVLDMVSGAAYALRASVERISHRNYLVAPTGVEIVRGEMQRETREDRGMREDRNMRDSRNMRDDRNMQDERNERYATQY